jgi:hypothetical protein
MPLQTLAHTVAEVVRRLLVDLGVGTSRANNLPWSAYHGTEPPTPDDVLTVFTTTGRNDGRAMLDGRLWQHFGFQVRVRSAGQASGALKADEVRTTLAMAVYDEVVTLDATHYLVHCCGGLGEVLPLGPEVGGGRGRYLFTVNGLVSLKQI